MKKLFISRYPTFYFLYSEDALTCSFMDLGMSKKYKEILNFRFLRKEQIYD